jgi:hypothetical protein
MKVEITKEEYRDLLDLLHIAHWVMIAHKTGEDPRTEKYEKTMQKFYSLAEEFGYSSLIDFDPKIEKYFPTRTFEETSPSWEFIDEFVDDTFWDELIDRLTKRDLERQVGGYEILRTLSMEARLALEAPIEERYAEEFNRNGLDNVAIVEQFGLDATKPVKTSD